MGTPAPGALAFLTDAIPVVQSPADRGVKFTNPALNQRVHDLATGALERWNGATWQIDFQAPTEILNAASYPGLTVEAQINSGIADCAARGIPSLLIPESMIPYDPNLVNFNAAVQLYTERGSQGPGIYDARAYGGVGGAWIAITHCCSALPATGGVVDCRAFTGPQTAVSDVFANVTAEKPIKLVFGPSVWTCTQGNSAVIGNLFGSNIEVEGNETVFILSNGQTQSLMWDTDVGAGIAGAATITSGSAVVVLPSLTRGVVPAVGKTLMVFGHVPSSGRDNTTLAAALTDTVGGTVVLTSYAGQLTAGQNTTGYLLVDSEIISYNAQNVSGNTITGCTRGALGTVAATHLNGATVDRVVYDNYRIRIVAGSAPGPWTVTLDRNVTCVSQTSGQCVIGPFNCRFSGNLVLDGGVPPGQPDTSANGIGITFFGSADCKVERSVRFQNWDHCGVLTIQSQGAVVDGQYVNCGHPFIAIPIGFSVLFFQGSKHCTAYGDYENVNIGPASDDRTTQPTYYDNLCDDVKLFPRSIRNVWKGASFEGTSHGYMLVPYVDNWNNVASGGAAVVISQPQWVTAPGTNCTDNYIELGWANPAVGAISLASAGGNHRVRAYADNLTATTGLTNAAQWVVEQVFHPIQFNGLPGAIGINAPPAYNVGLINKYTVSSVGGANFGYGILADVGGDTGITSNIRAIGARVDVVGGAALNTAYGVFILNPAIVSGTLNQAVGLWVDPQTAGAVNNNWAIRTNAGKVQLGDATYSAVGALAAPVATQYRVTNLLFQAAGLSTSATADTSVASFALLGTSLASTGQAVRIRAGGREVTQAGSFNVKFGATVLFTVAPALGASWHIDVVVTRTGAATQLVTGFTVTGATVASVAAQPTETLSGNVTIDFRGSVTSGGTLDLDYAQVEYLSAA